MPTPKPPRPTLREQIEKLADDMRHALVSHSAADRLAGRQNVAEAVVDLGGAMRRILAVLERIAPIRTWEDFLQSESQKEP